MNPETPKFRFEEAVILVGPADINHELLDSLRKQELPIIAVDGGANRLQELEIRPHAIIGDLDSFQPNGTDFEDVPILKIDDQNTTDFEKCLLNVEAPLYLAIGFTGLRVDHMLANLHIMAKYRDKRRILLLGTDDVSFIHQGKYQSPKLPLLSVSIVPFHPVLFEQSTGLQYPLDGLFMELGDLSGTSNHSTEDQFEILPDENHSNSSYLITLSGIDLELLVKRLSVT